MLLTTDGQAEQDAPLSDDGTEAGVEFGGGYHTHSQWHWVMSDQKASQNMTLMDVTRKSHTVNQNGDWA
ncbi:MAG: hypothetical protein U0800_12610 [Isosphaeraceae bacterium]